MTDLIKQLHVYAAHRNVEGWEGKKKKITSKTEINITTSISLK